MEEISKNEQSSCGCKGIRTCALCENTDRASKLQKTKFDFSACDTYVYASAESRTAWKIESADAESPIPMDELFDMKKSLGGSSGERMVCDNIVLVEDFLSEEEEAQLVASIDSQPWLLSQSGRRKQDYGPKVNFKQRKVKLEGYAGMPAYSGPLLAKMGTEGALGEYVPFELCNLEYEPARRSCIDFHTDDTWIWGERLVSINLLAGSVMSLLGRVEGRPRLVYVPMPRRSLLCMAGPMRYQWTHAVLPQHVLRRRIALTMREAAPAFRPEGPLYEKWGRTLIDRAHNLIPL